MSIINLYLSNDHLVLDYPYDPAQVAETKLIPGAKWDKAAKVWRVPMSGLNAAREFAGKHDFVIDTEVLLFDLPEKDNPTFGIEERNDFIYLSFGYDPVKVRGVKQIAGITWDADTKAWKAPSASLQEVLQWAEMFREKIPTGLLHQAEDRAETSRKAADASRATEGVIDVGELPLLPYQRAGVEYALSARKCFIADDMGLGKTLQAIAVIEKAQAYPAVVVCPANLVLNWRNEYTKWLPTRTVAVVTNRKDFPTEAVDVIVVGYSNLAHWAKQLAGKETYVFDESHYIKTPTAQRTKAAIKIARGVPQTGYVLCLTGTPITNRPSEYAAQLDVMGRLNDFGGQWGFYRRYCNAFRDRFGQWNISGNSHMDELNERLRSICYIRRTKEQVLKDLPPVRHVPLVVAGTDAGMREYRKAEADIVAYLVERAKAIAEELGKSPNSAAVIARIKAESNQALVEMSVLRRLAAKAKMDAVIELIEQHLDADKKVVIAAHHRDIVSGLAERFGGLRIQGGMEIEEVEEHKRRFQEESCEEAPVIVLSIQAAKTGHTLTAAQDVVFVELPWTPADIDQTYSRCHRLGQKGSVSVTYLLCEGTIDETMYDLIARKRGVVNAATDGSSPVIESVGQSLIELFAQRGLGELS